MRSDVRRTPVFAPLILAAMALAACGSASQSVTSPGGIKCGVDASAETTSFGANGGNGTVRISTNRECRWTADTSGAWIQLTGGREGQGDAQVDFSVSANPDPAARTGRIIVADRQIAIAQEPGSCQFTVSPLSDRVTSSGERRTIQVSANSPHCAWTTRSEREWLVVVEGREGAGNGRVLYEARATTGPTRTGSLTVAGYSVTVTQGNGCSTSVFPTSHAIGASGGSAAVAVAAAPGCAWSASSDAPWISIAAGASGAGPGTLSFAVNAWNGPTRSGTVRVNDQTVTVTQTAGCSFAIDPVQQSIAAAGVTGQVSVTTAPGCQWSATSQAAWISITSGAGGAGPGQVAFTVLGNAGPARSGALTIAGQAFTIQQAAAACSFDIDPDSQSFDSAGGTGAIQIKTDAHCAWTAPEPPEDWIAITSATSGTGSGEVSLSVLQNEGPDRSAAFVIAGQTFTVRQNAEPCSYVLGPVQTAFAAQGGEAEVQLTTGAACGWTAASSDESWLVVSPKSGTGPAELQFRVHENPGGSRSATLTIAGQAHTISQAGACSYAIDPAGGSVGADGGNGSIAVTAAPECTWTAASSDGWLQITGATSGTGNGTVSYAAGPNTGPERTGTIVIQGLSFVLQQANGCSITLSARGQVFDAMGGQGSFTVSTADGCSWSATEDADWISVDGGGSGTGAGTVQFSVGANSGPGRLASITVGGQTFTIAQSGV